MSVEMNVPTQSVRNLAVDLATADNDDFASTDERFNNIFAMLDKDGNVSLRSSLANRPENFPVVLSSPFIAPVLMYVLLSPFSSSLQGTLDSKLKNRPGALSIFPLLNRSPHFRGGSLRSRAPVG